MIAFQSPTVTGRNLWTDKVFEKFT